MDDKKQLPLCPRTGGIGFTLAVILNLILSVVAAAIIKIAGIDGTDGAKYISLLVSPVMTAIILALAVKRAKQPVRQLIPVRCHPKYYLMALLLFFGIFFSLSSVNDYVVKLFELMGYTRNESFLPDFSGWRLVPVLLVVAVIPAIAEEVMFRGMLLNNVEEGVGSVRTIFIVGMCFSLYHASVEQTVYQFICGCLYAFLAVRSRSVLPTVVIHFLNNALIIVLNAAGAVDTATGALIISQGAQIALYVLSALSLIGAIVWLVLDKSELKPNRHGAVKEFFIYSSVGLGALAVLWIAGLFV